MLSDYKMTVNPNYNTVNPNYSTVMKRTKAVCGHISEAHPSAGNAVLGTQLAGLI